MIKRTLKITTGNGGEFYSQAWSAELVESYEEMATKRFGGIKSMELIQMSLDEYKAIPPTNWSARLFDL